MTALTGSRPRWRSQPAQGMASDSAAAANVRRRLDIPNTPKIDDRTIEGHGSRPLRRSHEVRSLNFLHGMLQVSSRKPAASALFKRGLAGRRDCEKQPQVEPWFCDLCLFPLDLPRRMGAARRPMPRKKRIAYTAEQLLLNFASGLITGGSNCLDRHKIATRAWASRIRIEVEAARTHMLRRSQGIARLACQRVEQRLALFPYLRARSN